MKRITIVFFLVFIALAVNAQRSTKERPPSFAYEQVAKAKLQSAKKLTVPFDVQVLKAEDVENEKLGFPVRVAKAIPVNLTPENAGEWSVLPNGQRIWRLEIDAPDAKAVSLLYDKFIIPQGGKLFIYSTDYSVINIYTDRDNPKREEYSTDFIPGSKIRLEYVEALSAEQLEANKAAIPQVGAFFTKEEKLRQEKVQKAKEKLQLPFALASASKQESLQLSITGVSYAYKDVLATLVQTFKDIYAGMEVRTPSEVGQSGACEVNINNTEGANWYHQKKGVAATLQVLSDGSYICSGTVVNNVLGDKTPYFLMAYHCGGETTASYFNQWSFYFHWERTGAGNDSPLAEYKSLTGATKQVGIDISGGSDGLLLLLNSPIPDDWDVFYNGWDRRDIATAGGGVGIHHPSGDVKKISTYTGTPTSSTWNGSGSVGTSNAHWTVTFTATEHGHGVTEGGSSGSPLFNSDGRVIGTLTGGSSSCTNTSGANLYGKLAYHWDRFPAGQRMADFLDPNNSGVEFIDGTYGEAYKITFSASKTNLFASEDVTFTNRSYGDVDTWEWSFTGGSPASYEGENPPAVLYDAPGNFTAKLTAKKEGSVVGEFEVPIKVTLKQNYCPADITIGTDATSSQFPLGIGSGSNNRHTLSAAIYTATELGLTDGGLITDLEWTANTAVSTSRTLYIYLKEVDETAFAANSSWATEITGATLVYQQSGWSNVAGANKVTLTTPFTYSGTKNLKVLVRTSSTSASSLNSNTRYTASAANTHQQWTSNSTTLSTTATGTRNANRPNIKFYYNEPCGANAPVADFVAAEETLLLKEGFDTTVPPSGWTVEKPGASANQWRSGNPSSNNFNTIDPNSTSSAIIAYDSYNVVDSWLKSPAVAIDETGAKIEFYVLYSGSWLDGGATTFYVSDDEGSNWTTKWTTGTTNNTSLPSAWRKQEIDLSEYVGKSIRFAWQYYGQDGDLAGLDGVKVYLPNPEGKATIYEGEFVNFTDRSTGPVVNWNWTLPGGDPSTSALSQPVVQYMNAGVYDATLLVKNTEGTDEKTVPGAVTVRARTPVPQFASYSNGFIKYPDSGAFLPSLGGSVGFEHSTLYYPQSVAWAFPGANPSSSTEDSPEVEYPAGEAKYSVTLDATNSAGTGSLAKPDYIQVSGTAEVWNVRGGETPIWLYTISGLGVTGADAFSQTAERFEAPAGGEISRVRVYTSNVTQSASASLTLAIYSDNGGLPGTAISPVLQIQGGSNRIVNGGYNTLTFPAPVPVSGAFHVVIGSTNYNYTYFTVPCVENRPDGYSTVSAFYDYEGDWFDLGDLFGLYTSMNIIPEFTYTTVEPTSPVSYNKKNIDDEVETITFTTNGHSWTAAASGNWVQLSATSGSVNGGEGSLTFTVSENTEQDIRKGIIKLSIGGTAFTVSIKQAGAPPTNLTAAFNGDTTAVNLAWEHGTPHYKPGDNIFDDAEEYTAFTINPNGYYPWSYIDGDGATTYGVGGVAFPGSGSPMAFIAFNSSGIIEYEAKSGTNYFASIASRTPPNNDWLISPELGFEEEFTVSFWAKSMTDDYGLERFRVVYSTGGNSQADFTNVLTTEPYVQAPTAWTQYTYQVPADAKYVAINTVSDDAFLFAVDDIFIGIGSAPVSAQPTPIESDLNILNKESLKKVKPASTQPASENKLKTLSNDNRLVELTHKQGGAEAIAIPSLPALRSENATEEEGANEEALQWSDGTPYYIYGNPNGGLQEVAIRFAPEDLFFYDEATIKAVEILTYRPATNVKLNIRKGNQIIYSQDIEDITENLKQQRIELTTPVVIDATEDLYVGYEYVQAAGNIGDVAVAVADESPAVAGKGDLYSYNGAPFSSTGVGDWLITAYVEPAVVEVTFNVYKDGELLAEGVTEKSYTDTEAIQANTKIVYTVTAVYGKPELESTHSLPAILYTPVVITTEDSLEFCAGGSATLQVPYQEDYVYKWYRDGNLIAGASDSSYVATESGDYTLQVTTEDGTELPVSKAVTVTVQDIPDVPSISILSTEASSVTLTITNPQNGVSYQWYKDGTAIGGLVTSTTYSANETGTYSVIAANGTGCDSGSSNEILVTIVQEMDLFNVPTDPIRFAAAGGEEELPITITDPLNYIVTYGFNIRASAPDWISFWEGNGTFIFEVDANETNALRSGIIEIWCERSDNNPEFNYGYYVIEVSQKALQSIWFETPNVLLLQDEVYTLSATASSGLEVSFSLREEDAEYAEILDGNLLWLKRAGEIVVTASVEGDDVYEDAAEVSNIISIQTRTGIESVAKRNLIVYPNPSLPNHIIYVASGLEETELQDAFIDVYSLSGTLLLHKKATGKITEISLPTAGTYLLRLKGEEIIVIIK
jgi:PKD repeat protein